jgi:hypothetical protein
LNYGNKFIFTEGLDLEAGIQPTVDTGDHPTLYVNLFELGGTEKQIGKTFELALDLLEY